MVKESFLSNRISPTARKYSYKNVYSFFGYLETSNCSSMRLTSLHQPTFGDSYCISTKKF